MATTTTYGFEIPDDTDLVKDGALAMRDLGQDVDTTLATALNSKTQAGLSLIKTQTIGSAVASVTVTGAFSAAYDNYKIIVTGGAHTGSQAFRLVLGAANTAYFSGGVATQYGSPSLIALSQNNAAFWDNVGRVDPNGLAMNVDVMLPFASRRSGFMQTTNDYLTAGFYISNSGVLADTNSYTAFTVSSSAGSFTGGTIYVYGYGKS
jgi:hypothetical protein